MGLPPPRALQVGTARSTYELKRTAWARRVSKLERELVLSQKREHGLKLKLTQEQAERGIK